MWWLCELDTSFPDVPPPTHTESACPNNERRNNTTLTEPLHRLTDPCPPELGTSFETHAFGGSLWTIDYPGHFTSYYRPSAVGTDPDVLDTRILVPRWWIHMWFRKSLWGPGFSELFWKGMLKLPSEGESGFVLRKERGGAVGMWGLWLGGVRRDGVVCAMGSGPPYYLWNRVRVEIEAERERERGGRGGEKGGKEGKDGDVKMAVDAERKDDHGDGEVIVDVLGNSSYEMEGVDVGTGQAGQDQACSTVGSGNQETQDLEGYSI